MALLDLELVDIGDPLLDVMSFIHLACCNTGYGPPNLARARRFVAGYRTRRELTGDELVRGLRASIIALARSCFIESKVYLNGRAELAPLIARDAERFTYLEANLDSVSAGIVAGQEDESWG